MSDWYIHRDDEKFGPYTTRDLRSFAVEGRLQPDDKVWKDSLERPIRARQIKGLFTSPSNGDSSESPAADNFSDDDDDSSFDDLPELPQSRSSDKRSKAKEALGHGVDVARKALKTGTERLRATFGAAMKDTISSGFASFGELLAHPIQYAFGTLVLLIACALSVPGLITIVLIPVFVLGYIP
jgi:GYF domain 2